MSKLTKVLGTVALEPKGDYDANEYYEKLNTVSYNGSTFMATKASHNVLPTNSEYWQFIGGGISSGDIVDNLKSTSSTKVLSANQGREIDLSKQSVYNTLDEMKIDTDLADGVTVKTLGEKTLNDGGGAYYKINSEADVSNPHIELNNGLYANLINNFEENYYNEISCNMLRYNDETDYYITIIPKYDNNNEQINIYVGDGEGEITPIEYAQKEHTTLTINGYLNMGSSRPMAVIQNGEILREQYSDYQEIPNGYCYLGFKSDRSVASYKANETTAQNMINDGVTNALLVYYKIIDNSNIVDMSTIELDSSAANIPTDKNPRQCIGVKQDGTIIILSCDGRTYIDKGMTSLETAQILLNLGCVNAWNLDGGGSTSTIIKGSKINKNIDENGTKDRNIRFTFNVKKETKDLSTANLYSKIGLEKQRLINQLIPATNDKVSKHTSYIYGEDLNNLNKNIIIGLGNRDVNAPSGLAASGYFLNVPHSADEHRENYCMQLYFNRDNGGIYERRKVNGSFKTWKRTNATGLYSNNSGFTSTLSNSYEKVVLENIETTNDYDFASIQNGIVVINSNQFFKASGTIQLLPSSSGTKSIKLSLGTKVSVYTFDAIANQRIVVPFETFARNNSTETTSVKIEYSGSVGDVLSETKLLIEAK